MNSRAICICVGITAMITGGCGGSSSHTTSTVTKQITGTAASAPVKKSSTDPSGTAIVTLPQLGTLLYRCVQNGRAVIVTLNGQGATASEGVTVENERGSHLLAKTLLTPGTGVAETPPAAYRSLTWRIIQGTEPRTLAATIRMTFAEGPVASGPDAGLINCGLDHWSGTTAVIEHSGHWTDPSPWP